MRILISSMSIQNFQNYVRSYYFARCLVEQGHQVTLLTASPRNKWYKFAIENVDGVKVVVIPDIVSWRLRRGGLGPVNFLFRLLYVLTHRFDIYHGDGHRPAVVWPLLVARKLFGKPYVSEWMDLFGLGGIVDHRTGYEKYVIGPYDGFFEKWIRRTADGVIVLSEGLRERASGLREDANVLLLHGGADIESIEALTTAAARKHFEIPESDFVIGIVGVSDREDIHDLEILSEAILSLDDAVRMRVKVVLTGDKEVIERGFTDPGVKERLINLGWIDRQYYNAVLCAADIMFMPMKENERNKNKWPNKLGDFWAAGRPVISNPVGDIVPYFQQAEIGFLIDYDAQQLSRVLSECLADPERLRQMGQNARQLAEESASWQQRSVELNNFYSSLLEKAEHETSRTES